MDNFTYSDGSERFIDTRRSNIKSDLIEITEDKLENILIKNLKAINIRTSWINPLTLFLSLLLAKLTAADFNDFLGIPKDTWNAIFLIGIVLSFIWLVITLVRIVIYWNKSSIDYLLCQIKNTKSIKLKNN